MINTIVSMKTPRWGTFVDFQPNTFKPHILSQYLEEHKGEYLWCECISAQHLKNLTKLYFDRDVKRKEMSFSKEEIEDDYEFCMKKLQETFGDCEWAISQRHGYNNDKQLHCISWHFVCVDLFIEYHTIPELMKQKGLDKIFDNAVYKHSEQMWQLPWCKKTHTDTRILTPTNNTTQLHNHFIQETSHANKENTIIIKETKKRKIMHKQEVAFHKNERVQELQELLQNKARDTSLWYKSCVQDGNETHFYKTQQVRRCFVSLDEEHTSNNFVLNINKGNVYYKCMSKECVHKKGKFLGKLKSFQDIPKMKDSHQFDQDEIIEYRNRINEKLLVCSSNEEIKKISKIYKSEIHKYFEKLFDETCEKDRIMQEYHMYSKMKHLKINM